MSYCINPDCRKRENKDSNSIEVCESCQTSLLIENKRYKLIKRLSKNTYTCTEVFEVEDLWKGTQKILKTIHNDDTQLPNGKKLFEELVRLFEREQDFLINQEHEGLPKGEKKFIFPLSNDKELHCLVMEKIPGENLEKWLKEHGAIKEKQAIEWLEQLTNILDFIHQQQWFHRDIKPSNIIRRPNGKLVLIDLGTVRQITNTVIRGDKRTEIISQGYTPSEQRNGEAVPQSDFYALGRTFVHLLTGKHPEEIQPISDWRNNTKHRISESLLNLIDDLMADSPKNRPPNTQNIFERLTEIQNKIESQAKIQRQQQRRWLIRGVPIIIVLAGAWFTINSLRPKTCDSRLEDHLSCGEEVLTGSNAPPEKYKGVDQVKNGDYKQAVELLTKVWNNPQNNQPDPETLIYLNNAKIDSRQIPNRTGKVYTIAVAAPLRDTPDEQTSNQGLELLRGVAQAQNQAIEDRINLKVLIADDMNDAEQAKKIAKQLVSKSDILGVIGHYASEVTKKALPIYKEKKLVSISVSTSTALKNDYFFRIIPSDQQAAQALAKYLEERANPQTNQVNQQKIAVFWSPESNFSQSLRNEFSNAFGTTRLIPDSDSFNLSSKNFEPVAALQKAKDQGATAIVLIPDAGTTPNALKNAQKIIKSNNDPNLMMLAGDTLYIEDIQKDTEIAKNATKRLVVAIPWHKLSSSNQEFLNSARNFWKTDNVSWRTAATYDATRVLIEAIKKQPTSREDIRKFLSQNKAIVRGSATGDIQFEKGERANPNVPLVTIVPYCKPSSGYSFVPYQFSNSSCFNVSATGN